MRSITTFDLQYAHRFYGFRGEAQYLHGHTGVLTIEVEDTINTGVNMVYPCNEIQKIAWNVLKNFDLNPEKPDAPLYKNDAFQKVQKRRVPEKR